jgi:magnesium-transporting ATPase (P-type)
MAPLTEKKKEEIHEANTALAQQAIRVLGCAYKKA